VNVLDCGHQGVPLEAEGSHPIAIYVDTDVSVGWQLCLHDASPAEKRFDVNPVRRHLVDDCVKDSYAAFCSKPAPRSSVRALSGTFGVVCDRMARRN